MRRASVCLAFVAAAIVGAVLAAAAGGRPVQGAPHCQLENAFGCDTILFRESRTSIEIATAHRVQQISPRAQDDDLVPEMTFPLNRKLLLGGSPLAQYL